jgi:hypothetical protein
MRIVIHASASVCVPLALMIAAVEKWEPAFFCLGLGILLGVLIIAWPDEPKR